MNTKNTQMQQFHSICPTTNQLLKSYVVHTDEQMLERLEATSRCFQQFKKTSFTARAEKMYQLADLLEQEVEELALLMTQEMGKPIQSSKAEIKKCAWVCRFYAQHAADYLKDEQVETDATKSYISYQPLGVLLAIMPWNFPFWQVFRFIAPALMAGNVALLKHARNVSGCALAIEALIVKAGFPKDSFNTLLIQHHQLAKLLEQPTIMAASLTGGEIAGSKVAALAGSNIKKMVLELGGNDPYIVLEDANLELAVKQCVFSRLMNAGQSCIGAKRFIVVEAVYDEFLKGIVREMQGVKMGNPMDIETDLGPLARHDLRDEVHEQVCQSIEAGATLVLGGQIPDMEGAFYPPTILTDVKANMPAYDAEIFGPVAAVIRAKDEEEAIGIANDTPYGLGAGVFTSDIERGERIAREELQAGSCFVNHFVKSDPRLPFGGIKKSGYGRELGRYGILEFVNIKTISIA